MVNGLLPTQARLNPAGCVLPVVVLWLVVVGVDGRGRIRDKYESLEARKGGSVERSPLPLIIGFDL